MIRSKRSRLSVALCMVLVATMPPPGVGAGGGGPSDEEFEYAQTFRRSMGLAAGDGYVAASFRDASYSSAKYGLPLSPAELDELGARSAMRARMQPAVDAAMAWEGFGGVHVDQARSGTMVFGFTDRVAAREEDLRGLLPEGAPFEVVRVRYSYAELMAGKGEIARDAAALANQGIEIVEIGPDDVRNRVVVGVASDVQQASSRLQRLYGDIVIVESGSTSRFDCTRAGCRPMKGGLEIEGDIGASDLCTSAFWAKTSGGTKRLVTAGHCMVGRKGHTWEHGTPRNPFGNALDHTLDPAEATCGDTGDDYCADAGWFAMDETTITRPTRPGSFVMPVSSPSTSSTPMPDS